MVVIAVAAVAVVAAWGWMRWVRSFCGRLGWTRSTGASRYVRPEKKADHSFVHRAHFWADCAAFETARSMHTAARLYQSTIRFTTPDSKIYLRNLMNNLPFQQRATSIWQPSCTRPRAVTRSSCSRSTSTPRGPAPPRQHPRRHRRRIRTRGRIHFENPARRASSSGRTNSSLASQAMRGTSHGRCWKCPEVTTV